MSIKGSYDVLVIGGGPAGMMAAGRAGERGLSVLLVEKNTVLGKKLSITGGGRCNVTNAEFDVRKLLSHYGDAEQFLYSPFSKFGVQETFDFFEGHKEPLKVEDRKRVFPVSEKAPRITKVMESYVKKGAVTVLTNTSVKGFKTDNGTVTGVITDVGTFTAKTYILATGGRSHAETGSTGEGFSWLQTIGHTTHESNPNLVPLVVKETWIRSLSGTVLTDASISFMQGKNRIVKRGNILMTHFGLSGPTILNSAHEVKELLKEGGVTATIDLFPKEDIGALRAKLNGLLTQHSNRTLGNVLREWFPKALVSALLVEFPASLNTKAHSVEKELRHALVDRMKGLTLTITGTMGYDWAIVSDGGVDLKEVDTKTMRSKIHSNLYFAGDMLHINRPSGGYSLQLCWTTGYVAGDSVCR